ncbi:MAG: lysophospholipid acyltransferase family protein [Gemmatimonadota bacterium]
MTTEALKLNAVARLASGLTGTLGRTLRINVQGSDHYEELRRRETPFIFVLWHSQLLPLLWIHRNQGIVCLASEHRDGEYVTRAMLRLGYGAARGSSTRGGSRGLRELVRATRDGHNVAITPDGPVGPPRVMKRGPLVLARFDGLPILPLAIGGERVWRLNSWDRFVVPKPFASLNLKYGEPIPVPRRAGDAEIDALQTRIEGTLNRLTDEVDGVPVDPHPKSATEDRP